MYVGHMDMDMGRGACASPRLSHTHPALAGAGWAEQNADDGRGRAMRALTPALRLYQAMTPRDRALRCRRQNASVFKLVSKPQTA